MAPRMIDLILKNGLQVGWGNAAVWCAPQKLLSTLQLEATGVTKDANLFELADVFILDNVARYFFQENSKDLWYTTDFPNCAPPAPLAWYEWRAPATTLEEGVLKPWRGYVQAGALLSAVDLRGNTGFLDYAIQFCYDHFAATSNLVESRGLTKMTTQHIVMDEALLREKLRWAYTIIPFWQMEPHAPISTFGAVGNNYLYNDGRIHRFDTDGKEHVAELWSLRYAQTFEAIDEFTPERLKTLLSAQASTTLFPMWLGISMMHCKNVTSTTVDPCHQRKPPKPKEVCRRLHYKVLNIQPMQKVLRGATQGGQSDLKKSLHICRGHFRQYTDDGKLFGKYTGTFWTPQHLRGGSQHGIVVKDYNVKVS